MSKSFIFLVKSFLDNFYRHLVIFYCHTAPNCPFRTTMDSSVFYVRWALETKKGGSELVVAQLVETLLLKVRSSNPVISGTNIMALLVEQLLLTPKVRDSNPVSKIVMNISTANFS